MRDTQGTYVIETPRLALREMTPDDLSFIAEMLIDSETTQHYAQNYTSADVKNWLQRISERYERDGHAFWLAESKDTRQPIGQVGLLNQQVDDETLPEIGYMIHRSHWQQGYAHEATCAVRDYAFNTLGKQRVVSLIAPVNVPSQRVALAYGAKPEKLVLWKGREHLVFSLRRPS